MEKCFVVGFLEEFFPVRTLQAGLPSGEIEQATGVGVAHVSLGAGPRVVPGVAGHFCADGVAFDVAQRGETMTVIKRAGEESVLPGVSGAPVQVVNVLGESKMGTAQVLGESERACLFHGMNPCH